MDGPATLFPVAETVVGEAVTVRCEGTIADVRLLHRRLQSEGLTVMFGTHGMIAHDAYLGPTEMRRWFQLIVTGTSSTAVCSHVVSQWTDGGSVSIV